ncbi:hypothetical protein BDY24DRAFT_404875 [Mrakia frigida]|uniref:uncharacterized protein n=1 Tax=Mrakia frigida TaxID=29902 RepID=UPI003FCBF66C
MSSTFSPSLLLSFLARAYASCKEESFRPLVLAGLQSAGLEELVRSNSTIKSSTSFLPIPPSHLAFPTDVGSQRSVPALYLSPSSPILALHLFSTSVAFQHLLFFPSLLSHFSSPYPLLPHPYTLFPFLYLSQTRYS